jgi:hypothetical protein
MAFLDLFMLVFPLYHLMVHINVCVFWHRSLQGNSLYGSLPPELGNCTKLQQL